MEVSKFHRWKRPCQKLEDERVYAMKTDPNQAKWGNRAALCIYEDLEGEY